jgi:hypothetical protein
MLTRWVRAAGLSLDVKCWKSRDSEQIRKRGLKIFDVNQLLDSHMADLRHLLAVKAVYFKIFAQQRLPSPKLVHRNPSAPGNRCQGFMQN